MITKTANTYSQIKYLTNIRFFLRNNVYFYHHPLLALYFSKEFGKSMKYVYDKDNYTFNIQIEKDVNNTHESVRIKIDKAFRHFLSDLAITRIFEEKVEELGGSHTLSYLNYIYCQYDHYGPLNTVLFLNNNNDYDTVIVHL